MERRNGLHLCSEVLMRILLLVYDKPNEADESAACCDSYSEESVAVDMQALTARLQRERTSQLRPAKGLIPIFFAGRGGCVLGEWMHDR